MTKPKHGILAECVGHNFPEGKGANNNLRLVNSIQLFLRINRNIWYAR
jgi:hypothetical protein